MERDRQNLLRNQNFNFVKMKLQYSGQIQSRSTNLSRWGQTLLCQIQKYSISSLPINSLLPGIYLSAWVSI